jgi:hypothetical protein
MFENNMAMLGNATFLFVSGFKDLGEFESNNTTG